jgi:ribonuclease G
MANPKNRATVEEALRTELERDRTKTYVVEISPLGLVEMTRQNVTDGPRELMTRKCPTCGGDGIVYSEASAAIDVERRLRALAAGSRSQAFRVELADSIASVLIGPGARRLLELETLTKSKFFLEGAPETHLDHFVVLAEGKLTDLAPASPVEEGAEVMLQLVEVDRHDGSAAVGKLDGLAVVVAEGSSLVGKRLRVRVERVLDGTAYGVLTRKTKPMPEPLTAEAEAEKPTRKPPARRTGKAVEGTAQLPAEESEIEPRELELAEPGSAEAAEREAEEEVVESAAAAEIAEGEESEEAERPKKKTRRGSRGGRKRRKPAAASGVEGEPSAESEPSLEEGPESEAAVEAADESSRTVTIHLPSEDLERRAAPEPAFEESAAAEPEPEQPVEAAEASDEAEGDAAQKPKKKTRRGSRGGRKRRKPAAESANGSEPETASEVESDALPAPEPEPASENGGSADDWGYVPMSEWLDEIESGR